MNIKSTNRLFIHKFNTRAFLLQFPLSPIKCMEEITGWRETEIKRI